jgi:hypothetical protein
VSNQSNGTLFAASLHEKISTAKSPMTRRLTRRSAIMGCRFLLLANHRFYFDLVMSSARENFYLLTALLRDRICMKIHKVN